MRSIYIPYSNVSILDTKLSACDPRPSLPQTSCRAQACLCIRNIAARGPSLRQAMLDEGCETALREAGKLRGCVDEAYGALRDLQCDVRNKTEVSVVYCDSRVCSLALFCRHCGKGWSCRAVAVSVTPFLFLSHLEPVGRVDIRRP